MSSSSVRRAAVIALLVLLLASCGGSSGQAVRTGSPGQDPSFGPRPTAAATAPTSTTNADPGAPDPSATTTTVAAPDGGPADPSPIANLTPTDLRRVVEAPRRNRNLTGPTADRVSLPDGRTVWRVTITGRFPLRSARLTVTVGDRIVGQGISTPDGGALVAVTLDGTPLVAGAPVAWGPPGVKPAEAGRLAVVR